MCLPESRQIPIGENDFVILATQAVFEVVEKQEACHLAAGMSSAKEAV